VFACEIVYSVVVGSEDQTVNYGMPRPSKAERAELAKYVLDERTARQKRDPDREGARGSTCEDSGMSYGGRPRQPRRRRRAPQSRFDSYNTWKG